MKIWSRVVNSVQEHGRAALVTVAAVRGSSPREPGARMIVHPDGTFTGTIGGGTLEFQAIATARGALKENAEPAAAMRGYALGPELGQCCGGNVDVLFEFFFAGAESVRRAADLAEREAESTFVTSGRITDSGVVRHIVADDAAGGPDVAFSGGVLTERHGDDRRPLYLFGAGHVGRAIVLALAPLPFAVTWLDPRADAFPARYPANVRARQLGDVAAAIADAPAGSFALVLTHSHQLDLAVTNALLADTRFDHVGLIGSKTKRARFEKRLSAAGVAPERIAGLVCPIGLPDIRSKAPAAIAASTVAELIAADERRRRVQMEFGESATELG